MKREDETAIFRPFGQKAISSFLSKSRSLQEDKPEPPNRTICKTSKRDSVKVTTKIIKEKKSSFCSIGATCKNTSIEKDKEKGNIVINEAIFKQFNKPAPKVDIISGKGVEEGNKPESEISFGLRKRKNRFGCDSKNYAPKMVVLGDDPKPRQMPNKRITTSSSIVDKRDKKPIYDHYASGRGWWDGEREGVDNEEVGWTEEMWEGMGSSVLGNLY